MDTDRVVVVVIPMVPGVGLSPNARVHWGTHQRQVRELRGEAYMATKALTGAEQEWLFFAAGPGMPPRLRLDCQISWPKGRKRHDDDNAWAMIKPARDGVAQAVNINDAAFFIGTMVQTRGDGTITLTFRRHDQEAVRSTQ